MNSISYIPYLRALITLLFVLQIPLVGATLPNTMSYQAFVTDDTGTPINGEQFITFRLYTTESGGSMIWDEVQRLIINQGLLYAQLGAVTSLNLPDDFDTPLFLGIEIDFDGEMSPRQPLTLSGYAVQAANADTLDGQDADALDQSSHVSDTRNPHAVSAAQIGAATLTDIREHAALSEEHHTRYTNAEAVAAVQSHDGSDVNADTLDGSDSTEFAPKLHSHNAIYYTKARVDTLLNSRDNIIDKLSTRIEQLEQKLAKVTVTPDGNQIYVTGANFHVRSGSGFTDGSVNGLGNLIVGYNEIRPPNTRSSCSLGQYSTEIECENNDGIWAASHKSGSHNIVVGKSNSFSQFGGLVVGEYNTINHEFSSISGGRNNTASGYAASVSGGSSNIASGSHASITGGSYNNARGILASVTAGAYNSAMGDRASVSGGQGNIALGDAAWVGGGQNNQAIGSYASVSGGYYNYASGELASVSAGYNNDAKGKWASVSGGRENIASGHFTSITGGMYNEASATYASVNAGYNNDANGLWTSVGGGRENIAMADYSSISGGQGNETYGESSSVSGGMNNKATGRRTSVSGGEGNEASGDSTSISGGWQNNTSGNYASVTGGGNNSADGYGSSVVGGSENTVTAAYQSVIGGHKNAPTVYSVTSTSTTEKIATTLVHSTCALQRVHFTATDPGTNKYCAVDKQADSTWIVRARAGAANMKCQAICY